MERNIVGIESLEVFRGNTRAYNYMYNLTQAIAKYKQHIIEDGKKGELHGEELYVYEKYCVTGKILLLGTAKVELEDKVYYLSTTIGNIINGMVSVSLADVLSKNNVLDWVSQQAIEHKPTSTDINTMYLVSALDEYMQDITNAVECGRATILEKENYSRMHLGQPILITRETGVDMSAQGINKYKLCLRLQRVYDKNSEFYDKAVVMHYLDKHKFAFDAREKRQIYQNDVLKAIDVYKNDIISRKRLGMLKTKECTLYNRICRGECIELPYSLVINIGTEKYPLNINLSNELRKLSTKVVNSNDEEAIEFANRIVDSGVSLEDKAMAKIADLREQAQPKLVF